MTIRPSEKESKRSSQTHAKFRKSKCWNWRARKSKPSHFWKNVGNKRCRQSWNYRLSWTKSAIVRKKLCLSGKNYQIRCKDGTSCGRVFRIFRLSGNYSLKDSRRILRSTSQLSRWAFGEWPGAVPRFWDFCEHSCIIRKYFRYSKRNS